MAATLLVIHFCLIVPASLKFGLQLSLSISDFIVLIASCLFIAAGGYIVNDIFDIAADDINKPGVNLVGKELSIAQAWRLYAIFTMLGLMAGIYSAVQAGDLKLVSIQIIAAVSLYLYAASLKRITLLGNIIVALIIALSVITPAVFEPSLYLLDRPADWYAARFVWTWVLTMALFSFKLTLVREIVKDIEDREGDLIRKDATIALVWGTEAARGVATAILTTTLGLVVWGLFLMRQLPYIEGYGLTAYAIGVALLLLINLVLLLKAASKAHYHQVSSSLKLTMVAGLSFLIFFYLNIF